MAVEVLLVFYLLLNIFTPLHGLTSNITLCQSLINGTNTFRIDYGPNTKEGVIYSPAHLPALSTVNTTRGCYATFNRLPQKVHVDIEVIQEEDNSRRCRERVDVSAMSLTISADNTSCRFIYQSTNGSNSRVSFYIANGDATGTNKFLIRYSVLPLFVFSSDHATTINTTTYPEGYLSTNMPMNSTSPTHGVYELTLDHLQLVSLRIDWVRVKLDRGSYLHLIFDNLTNQSERCNSSIQCWTYVCNSSCTVTIQLTVGSFADVLLRYSAGGTMATGSHVTQPFNVSSTPMDNTSISTPHLNVTAGAGSDAPRMNTDSSATIASMGNLSSNGTTNSSSSLNYTDTGSFDFSTDTAAIVGVAVGSAVLLGAFVTARVCIIMRRTSIKRKVSQPSQQNPAVTLSIFYDDDFNYDTIDLVGSAPPCQGEDNFYHILDDSPATQERAPQAVEERNVDSTLRTATDSQHYYEAGSFNGSCPHLGIRENNSRNNNTLDKSAEEIYELIDDTRCEPCASCSQTAKDTEVEESDYEEQEIRPTAEIEMYDNELYEPTNFKK